MRSLLRFGMSVLAVVFPAALSAQGAPPAPGSVGDEIVVRGQKLGELRAEIERAQDVFIARFNDINSDDRFDIRCELEKRNNSNISERICRSNSWREQDANIGFDLLSGLRGEMGAMPQQYQAERVRMQVLLEDEMQRLTLEDPELRQAFLRLGRAMQAANLEASGRSDWTLFSEVMGGAGGLPFGARQIFQVRLGAEPWVHRLTGATFTIGQVTGTVRRLELTCAQAGGRLAFAADVEWTVPDSWTDCRVSVRGKRGTTFLLFEFDGPSGGSDAEPVEER